MRSRFSAYCVRDTEYLYNTYHPSVRPDNTRAQIATFAQSCHFIQLTVFATQQQNDTGLVRFNVSYIQQHLLCQFEETSRFKYEDKWYYLDGLISDTTPIKLRRNELCPCGSGKKFKQCQHLSNFTQKD